MNCFSKWGRYTNGFCSLCMLHVVGENLRFVRKNWKMCSLRLTEKCQMLQCLVKHVKWNAPAECVSSFSQALILLERVSRFQRTMWSCLWESKHVWNDIAKQEVYLKEKSRFVNETLVVIWVCFMEGWHGMVDRNPGLISYAGCIVHVLCRVVPSGCHQYALATGENHINTVHYLSSRLKSICFFSNQYIWLLFPKTVSPFFLTCALFMWVYVIA